MKKIFESKKSRLILSIVVIAFIVVFLRNFDIPNFIKSINPQKGDFIKVGKMSNPRYNHEAILLDDGTVLVFGGMTIRRNFEGGSGTADIYDPKTKKFTPVGKMLDARDEATATRLNNGKILRTGGRNDSFGTHGKGFKGTQIYNPKTKKFEKGPDMNFPRQDHTATLLNDGRVLIVGGRHNDNNTEIYDPKTNKFEIIAKMNIPRFRHSAVLLKDGRVLIVGGVGIFPKFDLFSSAEIYDPKTNKFELVGKINIARKKANLYLLQNGNVVIIGGIGEGHGDQIYLKDIEMYNPKTNEFKIIAKRNSPSRIPAAVMLENGTILFVGGSTGVGLSLQYPPESEIYNSETNTFIKGKKLNYPRSGNKATLLKDGNVLITGSYGTGRIAELYINK